MPKVTFLILLLCLVFVSCKKENETLEMIPISDYYPLQIGKYITYDLDSTVFVNFGKQKEVHSYQVKDVVDAALTDNAGRRSFRIIRYGRKIASDSWVANNTFMVTPTNNSLELIENNLRYIKLNLPIKEESSWRGNSFINTYTSGNDLRYLDNWDYMYDSIGVPLAIHSLDFDNTLRVFQKDEEIGDPEVPNTPYAEKTYSIEKYAQGVGLIYKEFLHWEYQGNTRTYSGYGVKLSVIDYN